MVLAVEGKKKQRDPFIETKFQEFLRKRGLEAFGLFLLVVSVTLALILYSYSPDDPGPFASSDREVHNFLGPVGAAIANAMITFIGWGAWGLPVAMSVWGARLLIHSRLERAMTCAVLVPFAIILMAAFLSGHVPPESWNNKFGLGGLLGDSILTAIMGYIPFGLGASLKIATLILLVPVFILSVYALGLTGQDLQNGYAFLKNGTLDVISVLTKNKKLDYSKLVKRADEKKSEASVTHFASRLQKWKKTGAASAPLPPRNASQDPVGDRLAAVLSARNANSAVHDGEVPILLGSDKSYTEPSAELPKSRDIPKFVPELAGSAPKTVVQHNDRKPIAKSTRAKQEEQPALFREQSESYELPTLSLLQPPKASKGPVLSDGALAENARMLESVLDDYGIKGEIVSVKPGPVVTLYELEPAAGIKASRVIGLADDIARSMSALAARVSTIPGRSVIGIELPNITRETVYLRELLSATDYENSRASLPLALGKDIGGTPIISNLARMPHLLIAGTTGSGKSVAINTMILSLLYTLRPDQCKLIMIDPKMLELSVYDGIPHLLSPVVTDPKKAVVALKWVVAEMEERYRKMSKMGVRNIDGYNERVEEALAKGENFERTVQTGFDDETGEPVFETEALTPEKMPFIVVIVDEMADLMMVAGKEIEACIQRLAQMARASGIHIIMATQRPSVDVITGTIKANFPTRISFQVTSKIDSRTILGEMGAEQLLGQGDMLYMAGGGRITRVHGPFVSDREVEEVVKHLKSFGPPDYESGVVEGPEDEQASAIDQVLGLGGNTDGEDALYDQAVAIVARDRKCSTSYIQRKLSIGYNKAATLVEKMEENGVVSEANHVGKRDILVPETA